MTFNKFVNFVEWCRETDDISVETYNLEVGQILIRDLNDTPGMIVCELLVSAYDSGYILGGMFADELNGCITIQAE